MSNFSAQARTILAKENKEDDLVLLRSSTLSLQEGPRSFLMKQEMINHFLLHLELRVTTYIFYSLVSKEISGQKVASHKRTRENSFSLFSLGQKRKRQLRDMIYLSVVL